MAEPADGGTTPEPDLAGSFHVAILCPECGDVVEVNDVVGILRALHLSTECRVAPLLRGSD